ncbi:MAG: PQQ-dependent sugar dehydrogenase [Lewinella sp.]
MKILLPLLLLIANVALGQIDDPIPESIRPSGQKVFLENFVTIPPSSNNKPFARINLLREVRDGSSRLFVNDLRGEFWSVKEGETTLFLDHNLIFPDFIDGAGFGTGFGAFDFHPDFNNNGLFYTAHTERAGSSPADFTPIEFNSISMQWVVTEWKMTDPSSVTFEGSRREILRFNYPEQLHGVQEIAFNPNAEPGDEDHGLLYICLGDGGSSREQFFENMQTTRSWLGTIFRIDPAGNNSANGKYGVPPGNPFFNNPDSLTVKEIYAYGFRNPHRISWDSAGDNLMLCGDIGEKNIEEVNLILPGKNYGWGDREGTFLYDRTQGRDFVWPLPSDDADNDYTYPIAQYDHDEGVAVVGGYVYRGDELPDLYGHYVFGDIASGLLFHFDVNDIVPGEQVTISRLATSGSDGFGTSLLNEVNNDRVDLRFGITASGEILLLTKADGVIRKMKAGLPSSISEGIIYNSIALSPNPNTGIFNYKVNSTALVDLTVTNPLGGVCYTASKLNSQGTLDLSHLANGTYYIILRAMNRTYVEEFVLIK